MNRTLTITDIIAEPLLVNGVRDLELRRRRVRELLDLVQLPAAYMNRSHAFSGGRRQRSASLAPSPSTRR
ncbi:MAG: hypothetical protein R3D25_09640 [Geminicoccaceae bacterium]